MSTASLDDVLQASGLLTLGDEPTTEAVHDSLLKLGRLADGCDDLTREGLRAGAVRVIRRHGWRTTAVDAVLGGEPQPSEKDTRSGTAVVLSDPEPWPDPVDGSELLDELEGAYTRHLAQPEGAAVVEALWTVHAHAQGAASVSPLLGITSASKRCGKTTALTLVGALVPRPLPASNITAAALLRAVEAYRPTLLVDEADTFLRDREELRGVLNSGHTRAGARVVRTVGDDHEARVFSTWCPKAVALIGDLPDTLADRSVEVRLRRRRPDETVERLRLDRLDALEPLRQRCARWASDNLDALRAADPEVPSELHDRAADNWRPLLAIADRAGGEWPMRARDAARAMVGADGDDGDAGVLLLGDLRDLFDEPWKDRLSSSEIVDTLTKMEERPWPEWRHGNPMTQRQLARMLKPYGVAPTQYREGEDRSRGYARADLEDAWARYLPARTPAPNRDTRDGQCAARVFGGSAKCDNGQYVTDVEPGEKPRGTRDVTHVTDGPLLPDDQDTYEAVERAAIQAEVDL